MTSPRFDRRTFALGGASALLLGCQDDEAVTGPRERTPTTQRVAVVGAGIAGLHCAYCLRRANIEVQVYEARPRVGGRLLSARNIFSGSGLAGPDEAVCEMGAEFVGTFDASMRALARELGIVLEDVSVVPNQFKGQRYLVAGTEVEESALTAQLRAALQAVIVPALQPSHRERMDDTTLSSWISENLDPWPNLVALLPSLFRTEFGLEPERLSALNLLALIGDASDSPVFHFFHRREPRFRAARGTGTGSSTGSSAASTTGMDQFATKMQAGLADRVHLDCRLLRVTPKGDIYTLLFEHANGVGFETEAEHVVFAIPFSVLRTIDLSALSLSKEKRAIINELPYGTTAKFAGLFSTRSWRESALASTGAMLDEARQVWDATQRSSELGVLATLVGGKAGLTSGASNADATFESLLPALERLFPTIAEKYVKGSAVRVDWPEAQFSLGSGACYRPGQWAQRGIEGRREGALHFCGEHCSLDFQGRLEGAAETGALAAMEIIEDLNGKADSYHTELVTLKLTSPQPYFETEADLATEDLLARLQLVSEEHAAFVAGLGNPTPD